MVSKYLLFSHTQSSNSVSGISIPWNETVHGFIYAFGSSIVISTFMRPKSGPPEPLDDVQGVAVRVARIIEPGLLVIADRIDDQRIALPSADGVSEPGGLRIARQRATVGGDLPERVIALEQHHDQRR